MNYLPDFSSGTVLVNGAQLYFERAGSGTPLVFIHSMVTDRRLFDDQFAHFATTNSVMRYDLRGYGFSEGPPGAFSHAADLAALCRELDLEDVIVVGVSKGGEIGLAFTVEHPEMVSRLFLCACRTGRPEMSADFRAKFEENDPAIEARDFETAIEICWRNLIAGTKRDPATMPPGVREKFGEMYDRRRHPIGPELKPTDLLERLHEVSIPSIIVVGEFDHDDVIDSTEALARGLRARKIVVEGAGHFVNLEQPSLFNELVREFAR